MRVFAGLACERGGRGRACIRGCLLELLALNESWGEVSHATHPRAFRLELEGVGEEIIGKSYSCCFHSTLTRR